MRPLLRFAEMELHAPAQRPTPPRASRDIRRTHARRSAAACAAGAGGGLRDRARAGRHLLHGRDARTLQLEPRHPLGRVAARPRRRRPGDKGRVDLLLADRPRQGRAGACTPCRASASPRPRPACRAAAAPVARPSRARASVDAPRAAGRGHLARDPGRRQPTDPPLLVSTFRSDPSEYPRLVAGVAWINTSQHHGLDVRGAPGALGATALAAARWRSRRAIATGCWRRSTAASSSPTPAAAGRCTVGPTPR